MIRSDTGSASAEHDVPARVSLGDLWQLGPHRLLCRDAQDAGSVARLFAGERATLTVTSPPYNMGRGPVPVPRASGHSKYLRSPDLLPTPQYVDLLLASTKNALSVSETVVVVLQVLAKNKIAVCEYLYQMRHHLADVAVWDKKTAAPAMARNVMNSRFELLLFFSPKTDPSRAIATSSFRGTVSNVYAGGFQRNNRYYKLHNATFPSHLPEWIIRSFDSASGVIFDPFLGTGTTLIAAHNLGRRCYGIEIDPAYCDITLDRWEKETGVPAKRLRRRAL